MASVDRIHNTQSDSSFIEAKYASRIATISVALAAIALIGTVALIIAQYGFPISTINSFAQSINSYWLYCGAVVAATALILAAGYLIANRSNSKEAFSVPDIRHDVTSSVEYSEAEVLALLPTLDLNRLEKGAKSHQLEDQFSFWSFPLNAREEVFVVGLRVKSNQPLEFHYFKGVHEVMEFAVSRKCFFHEQARDFVQEQTSLIELQEGEYWFGDLMFARLPLFSIVYASNGKRSIAYFNSPEKRLAYTQGLGLSKADFSKFDFHFLSDQQKALVNPVDLQFLKGKQLNGAECFSFRIPILGSSGEFYGLAVPGENFEISYLYFNSHHHCEMYKQIHLSGTMDLVELENAVREQLNLSGNYTKFLKTSNDILPMTIYLRGEAVGVILKGPADPLSFDYYLPAHSENEIVKMFKSGGRFSPENYTNQAISARKDEFVLGHLLVSKGQYMAFPEVFPSIYYHDGKEIKMEIMPLCEFSQFIAEKGLSEDIEILLMRDLELPSRLGFYLTDFKESDLSLYNTLKIDQCASLTMGQKGNHATWPLIDRNAAGDLCVHFFRNEKDRTNYISKHHLKIAT